MNDEQKKIIKAIILAVIVIAITMLVWYVLMVYLPGTRTFSHKTSHTSAPRVVGTIINFALPGWW